MRTETVAYGFVAHHVDGWVVSGGADGAGFENVDHSMLALFTLANEKHVVTVSLLDGRFEVDGFSFKLYDESTQLALRDFKLVYWRRRRGDVTGEIPIIGYRIGWEARDAADAVVTRIMEIQ